MIFKPDALFTVDVHEHSEKSCWGKYEDNNYTKSYHIWE